MIFGKGRRTSDRFKYIAKILVKGIVKYVEVGLNPEKGGKWEAGS